MAAAADVYICWCAPDRREAEEYALLVDAAGDCAREGGPDMPGLGAGDVDMWPRAGIAFS